MLDRDSFATAIVVLWSLVVAFCLYMTFWRKPTIHPISEITLTLNHATFRCTRDTAKTDFFNCKQDTTR